MNRRNILIGLGVVAAGAAAGGGWWLTRNRQEAPAVADGAPATTLAQASGEMPIYEDDHIMGRADAPVSIVEFASLTCPHCATFHVETLPRIKEEWIDTGRARLVFRHFPLDQLALRAAAAANCVTGDAFFGFLDVLFKNQDKWTRSDDPLAAIGQYAALAGLDKATYEKCLTDEAAIDRILEKQAAGRDRYNIASTPSFVINGTPVAGNQPYEEMNRILEEAATKAS